MGMTSKSAPLLPRVLIITDNIDLYKWFRSTFDNKSYTIIADYNYRYSLVNKAPDKFIEQGVKSIDLTSDIEVARLIETYEIIFSLHSKKIFPTELVNSVKCINVHPGLNPYNRGWYPQVFSIINKLPIGATIHEMDGEIDHGPIVCQEEVDIDDTDDSFDVYQKVIAAEKRLLSQWLPDIIEGNYCTFKPVDSGNYNSIGDFKSLCELELDSIGTLGEHIDLLRALTYSNYKNAFFLAKNGGNVFVRVILEREP